MKSFSNQTIKKIGSRILFVAIGAASLIWFLVRTLPKPSRATYPCQRIAFPFASSFLIWLSGTLVSFFSFKKARKKLVDAKLLPALLLIILALTSFISVWFLVPSQESYSRSRLNRISSVPPPILIKQLASTKNTAEPLSRVSLIKADAANVSDLTTTDIESLVRKVVDNDGVLSTLITDGQTVVIKPNLVSNIEYSGGSANTIPVEVSGIVTDWRVVRAIALIVREYNPNGTLYIMEGSASDDPTSSVMIQYGYTHANIPGVDGFLGIEDVSGGWEEWDSELLEPVILPPGKGLYPNELKPNQSDEYYMNRVYYEADVIISVPVLKNHDHTGTTGSVKNVGIGATPARIYASPTANQRYLDNRIDHDNTDNLQKFIHDYYLCRPVDYTITDGLQGSDYGPLATHPTSLEEAQKNMGIILAGSDAIAVDAIAALLMSYDPSQVNYLVYLHNDLAGCADPATIRIDYAELQNLKKDFTNTTGLTAKYNDLIPPEAELIDCSIESDTLRFSLSPSEEIMKTEILVDSQFIDLDILGGFENVKIGLDTVPEGGRYIEIRVHDAYLNSTSFFFEEAEYEEDEEEEEEDTSAVLINEGIDYREIKMYPNPADNYLHISLPQQKSGRLILELFDMQGRLVNRDVIEPDAGNYAGQINVSHLKHGIYILRIRNSEQNFSKKILVGN